MKKTTLFIIPATFIFTILLAGCGGFQTPVATLEPATPTIATPTITTPTITTTPDLCAPENVQAEVNKVHGHMREFDDAVNLITANVATGIQRDQLSEAIANLQRIRRESEEEEIQPCLLNLKAYQVQHMNSGINTFIALMSGANQETVDQAAAIARQQHDQYILELARVLGITPLPATAVIVTPLQTP